MDRKEFFNQFDQVADAFNALEDVKHQLYVDSTEENPTAFGEDMESVRVKAQALADLCAVLLKRGTPGTE